MIPTDPISPRSTIDIYRGALDQPSARRRVLDAVAGADHAITVEEVASILGCHPSSARPHLSALAELGLVEVTERRSGMRGRPAALFSTRLPDPARIHTGMMGLINSGLDLLSAPDAYKMGYAWGRSEREREDPAATGLDPQQVALTLARIGFEASWEGENRMRIRSCPLEHRSPEEDFNLWELHRGLVEGLLGDWGGSIVFHRDDPSGGCVVEFVPRG